jgi:hypothetical protein
MAKLCLRRQLMRNWWHNVKGTIAVVATTLSLVLAGYLYQYDNHVNKLQQDLQQQAQQNAIDPTAAELISIASSGGYIQNLDPATGALWMNLARMAEETESIGVKEWSNDFIEQTPITVSFRDDNVACTAVVGIRMHYRKSGRMASATLVKPCLVFYVGGRHGQSIRLEGIRPTEGEYRNGLFEWRRLSADAVPTYTEQALELVYRGVTRAAQER